MILMLDDRFKVLGVLNGVDKKKSFSKAQKTVVYSLVCLIRSILYFEYYKRNPAPNTEYILHRLHDELEILKAKNAAFKNWINDALSKSDILLQKIEIPSNVSYIKSVEQSY